MLSDQFWAVKGLLLSTHVLEAQRAVLPQPRATPWVRGHGHISMRPEGPRYECLSRPVGAPRGDGGCPYPARWAGLRKLGPSARNQAANFSRLDWSLTSERVADGTFFFRGPNLSSRSRVTSSSSSTRPASASAKPSWTAAMNRSWYSAGDSFSGIRETLIRFMIGPQYQT
jgi:hypothetical protein